jgi:hypothetical protein
MLIWIQLATFWISSFGFINVIVEKGGKFVKQNKLDMDSAEYPQRQDKT